MQALILVLGVLLLGACGGTDRANPFSALSAPDGSLGGSPGVGGGAQEESGSGGASGVATAGSAGVLGTAGAGGSVDAGFASDGAVFGDAAAEDAGSVFDGAVEGSVGGFGGLGIGGSSGSAGALSGGSGGAAGVSSAGAGGLGGSAGLGGFGGLPGGAGTGGAGGSGGQPPMCVEDQINNQCRDSATNNGWLQNDRLGRCFHDRCCGGCMVGGRLNGTSCEPGTALNACGNPGQACQDCEDYNECTIDSCLGSCSNQGVQNVACTSIAGSGVCKAQIGGTYGCIPCGGIAELCCVGDTCDSGLSCTNDRCKAPCGNSGEACCSGSYCNTGLFCQSGTCEAPPSCGGLNEACCATGSQCKSSLSACVNGVCISCGNPNGPCCPGAVCTNGYFCIGGSCGTR